MGVGMQAATQTTIACGVYILIGQILRRVGLFQPSDAAVALKIAKIITSPAAAFAVSTMALLPCQFPFRPSPPRPTPPPTNLNLQGIITSAFPSTLMLVMMAAGTAHLALTLSLASFWSRSLPPRASATLLGCASGTGLLFVMPLLGSALGPAGTAAGFLVGLPLLLAGEVGVYYLMSTAGAPFPASYTHNDGGVYRGEWRGVEKNGRGAYQYASGARYEGEWRSNVKDGRGIYYYPKGGSYQGEWSKGVPQGVGVRTFANGATKAGRWAQGELVEPLELWQCASSAQGASEAATAARALRLGGFQPKEALAIACEVVPAWTTLLAFFLVTWSNGATASGSGVHSPSLVPSLSSPASFIVSPLTAVLTSPQAMHAWTTIGACTGPLVFLAFGILGGVGYNPRVLLEASRPLVVRLTAGAVTALGCLTWLVGVVESGVPPTSLTSSLSNTIYHHPGLLYGAVALGALAMGPLGGYPSAGAERFRLSGPTVGLATFLSRVLGVPSVLAVIVGGASVIEAVKAGSAVGAGAGAGAGVVQQGVGTTGVGTAMSTTPWVWGAMVGVVGVVVVAVAGWSYAQRTWGERVRMVYAREREEIEAAVADAEARGGGGRRTWSVRGTRRTGDGDVAGGGAVATGDHE